MPESVMELLKYHLQARPLSSFQRRSESSHFLSWWGASRQALFSHATSLGEVAAFGTYIKYVVEQPSDSETENGKSIRSIEQVLMEAQVS